jgi:hypothetical protein
MGKGVRIRVRLRRWAGVGSEHQLSERFDLGVTSPAHPAMRLTPLDARPRDRLDRIVRLVPEAWSGSFASERNRPATGPPVDLGNEVVEESSSWRGAAEESAAIHTERSSRAPLEAQALIRMSTPAGMFRLLKASTVCAVGSEM